MTPEDLAAIRARDAQPFGANDLPAIQLWRDRRALLTALDEANAECAQARAEVDRLTALVNDEALLVMRGHAMVQEAERARLRAAVEGLPGARVFGPAYGTASSIETDARLVRRAAVLAIVEGTDGRE